MSPQLLSTFIFYHSLPTSYTGCLIRALSKHKTHTCLRAFALALPSASVLFPRFLHSGSSNSFEPLLTCHVLRQDFLDCFSEAAPTSVTPHLSTVL